jgi:hypothetical protein
VTRYEHAFYTRENDEQRTVFRFTPLAAPVKCSVFALMAQPIFQPAVTKVAQALTRAGLSRKVDDSGESQQPSSSICLKPVRTRVMFPPTLSSHGGGVVVGVTQARPSASGMRARTRLECRSPSRWITRHSRMIPSRCVNATPCCRYCLLPLPLFKLPLPTVVAAEGGCRDRQPAHHTHHILHDLSLGLAVALEHTPRSLILTRSLPQPLLSSLDYTHKHLMSGLWAGAHPVRGGGGSGEGSVRHGHHVGQGRVP